MLFYFVKFICNILLNVALLSITDFRSLNIQKHINDNNSSRGVAEVCGKHVNSQKESQAKAATICIPSKTHFRWRKLYKTWKKKSLKHLSSSSSVKKICSKVLRREDNVLTPHVDAGLCQMKASWKIFSFSDLQKATNNFSEGFCLVQNLKFNFKKKKHLETIIIIIKEVLSYNTLSKKSTRS